MGSKEIKEDPTISQGTLLVAHTAQTWEGKNQSAQQDVVVVVADYYWPVGFANKDFGLENMFFLLWFIIILHSPSNINEICLIYETCLGGFI